LSTSRTIAFGTCGPARLADISLRIWSTCRHAKRRTHHREDDAPRLILTGLHLDLFCDDDGNARRQSATAMTRAVTNAAATTRLMIIVCRMSIRAICQGTGGKPRLGRIAGTPRARIRPETTPARQKPIGQFVSERLRCPKHHSRLRNFPDRSALQKPRQFRQVHRDPSRSSQVYLGIVLSDSRQRPRLGPNLDPPHSQFRLAWQQILLAAVGH
jgi:hypothetical protein